MAFKDCYKNFIWTLCNFENWIGDKAKWIDSCDNSNDEDITIYTDTIQAEALETYLNNEGTTGKDGEYCYTPNFMPNTL